MSKFGISNLATRTKVNPQEENITRAVIGNTPLPSNGRIYSDKKTTIFSSLSSQLNEAAIRAETRASKMTRQELAAKGEAIQRIVAGPGDLAQKKIDDTEVPKTDDPIHLERAKQATAFTNREGPNPFKGINREQLSLIAYDESGTFTINERRAAWVEACNLDVEQKKILCEKIVDEYNRTGKIADSLLDVFKFYKSLPAIDQAVQFSPDYEMQLISRIRSGGSTESLKEILFLCELPTDSVGNPPAILGVLSST